MFLFRHGFLLKEALEIAYAEGKNYISEIVISLPDAKNVLTDEDSVEKDSLLTILLAFRYLLMRKLSLLTISKLRKRNRIKTKLIERKH